VGRAQQKSPAPRRLVVVAMLAAGLVAAGCSAGQVTQTDTQVAAVNGASGQAGAIGVRDAQLLFPSEHKAYAEGDDAPLVVTIINSGGTADKLLSVTSDSSEPAEAQGDVELEPGTSISSLSDQDDADTHPTSSSSAHSSSVSPTTTTTASSGAATTTTTPPSGAAATTTTTGSSGTSESVSVAPTTSAKASSAKEPIVVGKAKITLKKLAKELRPGQTIKVTFLFEKAGPLTLELPIGADPSPRAEHASEH